MDFKSELCSLIPSSPFSRREFIATTLAAGFAAAVQPIAAETVIHTETQGLDAGEVKIPAGDADIPAYRAAPKGGKNLPIVLVVQEIFGVHEHIRDVCRRLAKLGYLAVATELYARQGDASKLGNPMEIMQTIVARVPDGQVMKDLDASAAWAEKNGGDGKRLAITGFCWGGRIVWLYAAHNPRLKAGVAWYGRLTGSSDELRPKQPIDLVSSLKAPVLGLYGEADQGIPLAQVEAMKASLAAAKKTAEFKIYMGAPHGFHADYRPSYRKEAAEDAWNQMQAWFRKYKVLGPAST
jgi:carboxymethylenebutenolidase